MRVRTFTSFRRIKAVRAGFPIVLCVSDNPLILELQPNRYVQLGLCSYSTVRYLKQYLYFKLWSCKTIHDST
jgi:hypothetical protein